MNIIKLNNIIKSNNILSFEYMCSEDLNKFFSNKPFVNEYPLNLKFIPNYILSIPFVCNVLPIIWLTDSTLQIDEIDKDFFDCIPLIRDAYQKMFPESKFLGQITPKRIIKCNTNTTNKVAAFYSGGLDAVNTLLSHINERPDLISIWGADIKYENIDGWKKLHTIISETAQQFSLSDVVIRSSFRDFDNESALDATFSKQLKDGWWHGLKHSLGLIGHAAPYVYQYGVKTLYIASTNCPLDEPVRCASHPTIDNLIRFANCSVVHDGYEMSRQDKAHNVANLASKLNQRINLKVCWVNDSGTNCCECEKCYRTIMALIAENADPIEYGFNKITDTLPNIKQNLLSNRFFTQENATLYWTHIQRAFIKNKKSIKKKNEYWKQIKWIYNFNFNDISKNAPKFKNIRGNLSNYKFYQTLHKIKVKLHRK